VLCTTALSNILAVPGNRRSIPLWLAALARSLQWADPATNVDLSSRSGSRAPPLVIGGDLVSLALGARVDGRSKSRCSARLPLGCALVAPCAASRPGHHWEYTSVQPIPGSAGSPVRLFAAPRAPMGPRQRAATPGLCAGWRYPAGFGPGPRRPPTEQEEVLLVVLSLTFFLIFLVIALTGFLIVYQEKNPLGCPMPTLVAYRPRRFPPRRRSDNPTIAADILKACTSKSTLSRLPDCVLSRA